MMQYMMMMSATPLTILLMSTSMAESKLQLNEKLTRNLVGMFPQEVAASGSGPSMSESTFKTYLLAL